MKRVLFAMLVVVSGACGGDDDANPAADCEERVEITCARLYECLTEAERDFLQLPPTEAGCITDGKQNQGCEEQTLDNVCQGGEVYDPAASDDCVEQIAAIDCGDARDGIQDDELPACGEYCAVE